MKMDKKMKILLNTHAHTQIRDISCVRRVELIQNSKSVAFRKKESHLNFIVIIFDQQIFPSLLSICSQIHYNKFNSSLFNLMSYITSHRVFSNLPTS